jgi:hypothetical protein
MELQQPRGISGYFRFSGAALMLMPLFMARFALADMAQLAVTTDFCTTNQTSTLNGPGPLTVPISCTPTAGGAAVNGSATGTATANFLPVGSGSDIVFSSSSSGLANVETSSYDPDFLISGVASGTPVALTFSGYFSGSYSYSTNALVYDELVAQIGVSTGNGVTFLLNDTQFLTFCDVAGPGGAGPCNGFNAIDSASGSGNLTVPFQSNPYDTTAGGTLTLTSDFNQTFVSSEGSSSFTGDFLDPFTITNIEVTNPTTGQPLSGISITGAYGISYPVNVTSVPEPSSLGLLGTVIVMGFVFRLYASVRSRARI